MSGVRILHTSDWHLGLQSGRFSRAEEHALFFKWLHGALSEHEVDALIVAGDIFDGMSPSSESQRLYYRFLRDIKDTGVVDVVIVGGNHDSASQLEAPRAVLSALDVHVVGGYSRESDKSSYLVPLRRRGEDKPTAICIALPYVHEWRLGIRTTEDSATTRKDFVERFSALYSDLCDLAEKKYPGLPLVGTGHLTIGKSEKDDSPQEIHQVGFIDSLPPEILDARLKYVALGHIHRSFSMDKGRLWYSGSPIPVSLPEMARPRRVLLVDLEDGGSETDSRGVPAVTPLSVPISREMIEFSGTKEEIFQLLRGLSWKSALPPFLFLRVLMSQPDAQLGAEIRQSLEAFSADERPLLVEIRERYAKLPTDSNDEEVILLEDLSPREVFIKLCRQRDFEASDELLQAFDHVRAVDQETLSAELETIKKGLSTPSAEVAGNAPSSDRGAS